MIQVYVSYRRRDELSRRLEEEQRLREEEQKQRESERNRRDLESREENRAVTLATLAASQALVVSVQNVMER